MISSSVLILIVICMRYFLKGKTNAKLQYALWLLVAVRLLVPISFGNSVLSVENIINRISSTKEDSLVQDMAQENMIVESEEDIVYPDVVANEGVPGTDVNEETTYVPTESNTPDANVLLWIWPIGVGGTVGVFLITNIVFQRRAKKDRNVIYVNWCKRPVYVTDEVETPCLVGVFSPIIYVTREVAEDSLLLRHTVTHETMHYKQGDSMWALIRCLCLALHWYNPLVWYAAILSKKDAEFSCDEATINALGEEERKDYGKTLIQLSSKEKYNLFLTATAMTSGKKSIKERIVLIAKKPKAKWYTLVVCLLISCVAVGCTFTQGENSDSKNNVVENETQNGVTENIDQEIFVDNQNVEPVYYEQLDENKVCLAVMPDGISTAGGDYRYIIPEDQTKWMDGYKQMRSQANGDGKWKSDERSMGVWIVFGEEWTCITDQGFIYDFEKRIEKSDAEDFYNLCMEEAYKNGIEPIRPEDIGDLASVSIEAEGYGTITITDDYILDEIQKTFNLSTELRGGAACPFTTSLILKSEDGKKMHTVYLASDTCSVWLSDGVYYEDSYGITEGLKDMLNAQKLVVDFSEAYFANDVEALKNYMLPTSSVEATGYSEGEMPPAFWTIDGLEGCIDNFKTIISVEFRVSEDADYFVYLEICIRKQEGEWKVESYWLEQ